jgi:predicted nucleotidyltransferase
MVISEERLQQAVRALRSLGARKVLLFGSCVRDPEKARDIDLAAEGIPLSHVWKADGQLSDILGFPCDLVVREESPSFYELIEKHATVLYEQAGID